MWFSKPATREQTCQEHALIDFCIYSSSMILYFLLRMHTHTHACAHVQSQLHSAAISQGNFNTNFTAATAAGSATSGARNSLPPNPPPIKHKKQFSLFMIGVNCAKYLPL